MQNTTATIYCPNHLCQAPNPESHKFCQKCRTLLPKRYLWAVGQGVEAYRPGELLAGRYLLKRSHIVLDTQPGLLPDPIAEIPQEIYPYLRLVPYKLQVPQVYALVRQRGGRSSGEILLLEQVPIYPEIGGNEAGTSLDTRTPISLEQPPVMAGGQLMPELGNVWKQSSALRQLNWLWQMATLWQPLSSVGVASSLLVPALIRVEGSLVRLLELRFDSQPPIPLAQLGQFWLPLSEAARPELTGFLTQICQWLIQGQIKTTEDLILLLDRGLAVCGQAQTRQISLATLTDQGPSRSRNEDACYPASGTTLTTTLEAGQSSENGMPPLPLVIVCDGIGGHEGGNVASNLAIEAVQQQLSQLPSDPAFLTPVSLSLQLESSVYVANDRISQRNDQEQRQDRQRMGTTLVMALPFAHQVYITHVGDSRVYRITRTGCHQVTLDDDVASREVRLGYALYRDALQQAASGSLVQALGMSTSDLLHPTVQRFTLDEDCVFLLCSDGLSDHDRVEEYWETELLPILTGNIDVATASKRLVEIANTRNGHDNVTVGVLHCRVAESGVVGAQSLLAQLQAFTPAPDLPNLPEQPLAEPPSIAPVTPPVPPPPPPPRPTAKTQILPAPPRRTNPLRVLASLILLLGSTGILIFLLVPSLTPLIGWLGWSPPDRVSSPQPPASPSSSPTPSLNLPQGALIQLNGSALPANQAPANPVLFGQPAENPGQADVPQVAGSVPLGSVVQILGKLEGSQQANWLNLKVCSTPTAATAPPPRSGSTPASPSVAASRSPVPEPLASATGNPSPRLLRPGETGWILEQEFEPLVSQELPRNPGVCKPNRPATPAATPAQ